MQKVTAKDAVAQGLRDLLSRYEDKYVISLASRPDRRARVQREFAVLGVDMAAAGVSWFDGLRFDDAAGFPNAGVRGCFSSHLALLKRCADNGRPMLIMEDDIEFNRSAPDTWRQASLAADNWDIIYFGYISPSDLTSRAPLIEYDGTTIGAHFYAITPAYAAKMADFMDACQTRPPGDPLGGPMYRDGAFNHYRLHIGTARTLLAVPTLAHQFASRSDLAVAPRFYDRVPALQPLSNLARKLKSLGKR